MAVEDGCRRRHEQIIMEIEQVKDRFGELPIGTQQGREREREELHRVMEGQKQIETKIEGMEEKLVRCVEAQCERQGVLLREQGERICSPRGGSCPGGAGVTRWSRRVARCGGVHAKLGEGRGHGVFWPNAGTQYDCSGGCAECESNGLGE